MKQRIKKIVEVILIMVATISFVLMGAEKADGTMCYAWSFGWFAASAACGLIIYLMNRRAAK